MKRGELRNELAGGLHLSEQERSKRIAGGGNVVSGGIIAAGAETVEIELPAVLLAQPVELNWWWRNSYPTLMVCLPAIHVRSLANCQRLMASNPNPIHCVPSEVYGMLPVKVKFGAPAVLSRSPLLPGPHSLSPQPTPALIGVPPMNQRSHEIVAWYSRLFLMM